MGRFIVSRTASGVRFLLQSEKGRTLVHSKEYATLDACKKGICSLVYYAPIIPVIDLSLGESAPNPKFELDFDGKAYSYTMKSANGKSVVTVTGFATKKACLRAISMLRTGVLGAEVMLCNPAGYIPLTVGSMVRDSAPLSESEAAFAEEIAPEAVLPIEAEESTPDAPDLSCDGEEYDPTIEADGFADIPSEVGPAPLGEQEKESLPTSAPADAVPLRRVPRRVQIPGEQVVRREPVTPKKPEATEQKQKSGGFFKRFFGR